MKSVAAVIVLIFLASSASGRILECTFEVSAWPIVGNLYSCRATIVDARNPSSIQSIRGVHLPGRDNSQVEGFSLSEQNFGEIPRNLATFFSKLKAVDFTNAQISTLSLGELTSLTSLRFLRLFNNKITAIPSDLFKSNSQLQYIDFAGNRLQSVGANLLGNLSLLSAADFSNNPCINVQAFSRAAIADLNQILPIRCATPVTTTAASTSTISTTKTTPVVTTTNAVLTTTSAVVSTTSPVVSTTSPVVSTTSPLSTSSPLSTVASTSSLPTVSSVTVSTSATTTELPKQCTVSCPELEQLRTLVDEQVVIIAYLEERLRLLESK